MYILINFESLEMSKDIRGGLTYLYLDLWTFFVWYYYLKSSFGLFSFRIHRHSLESQVILSSSLTEGIIVLFFPNNRELCERLFGL